MAKTREEAGPAVKTSDGARAVIHFQERTSSGEASQQRKLFSSRQLRLRTLSLSWAIADLRGPLWGGQALSLPAVQSALLLYRGGPCGQPVISTFWTPSHRVRAQKTHGPAGSCGLPPSAAPCVALAHTLSAPGCESRFVRQVDILLVARYQEAASLALLEVTTKSDGVLTTNVAFATA